MSWRKPHIPRRSAVEQFEQQAQQAQQQEEASASNIIYGLSHMRGSDTVNRELAEYLQYEGERETNQEYSAARANFRSTLQRRGSILERMRAEQPITMREQRGLIEGGEFSQSAVRQASSRLQRASRRASVSKAQRKEKLKKFKPQDLRPPGTGRKGPPPPPPPSSGAIRIPV
jgi:hypothetical protein